MSLKIVLFEEKSTKFKPEFLPQIRKLFHLQNVLNLRICGRFFLKLTVFETHKINPISQKDYWQFYWKHLKEHYLL